MSTSVTHRTILRREPPEPPALPFVGHLRYVRRPHTHLAFLQAQAAYGDVVRFHVGRNVFYLLAHPDAVQHVLVENNRNYVKGFALQQARPVLGNGLLTSEGDFWRRQRRLIQPAFHRRSIENLAATMIQVTEEHLAGWEALAARGEPVDASAEMMRLTLDIAARTLFGANLAEADYQVVAENLPLLLEHVTGRVQSLFNFAERLPLPANRRAAEAVTALDRIVYRIIEERRRSGRTGDDLLGLLMAAQDEDSGAQMTDLQLRDEVMTLFLAGHETTALLMSWLWTALSLHPDVRRRVEAEVDQVLGGERPTVQGIQELRFTDQVITEVLRLYPPAWAIPRTSLAEDEVGGYPIPAGVSVVLSPYVTHRHPDFWENPAGFDPERHTPERRAARHRYAYFPFGAGPRLCIGEPFALMEARIVTAMVCRRYRLDLLPARLPEPGALFTLRPLNGVWVRISRR